MVKYKRVSYEIRCQIEAYLKTSISILELSRILGVHKTTIYREINRNKLQINYSAIKAEMLSKERFQACKRKLIVDENIRPKIENLLIQGWSPEQISARIEQELNLKINYKTIYNFIKREGAFRSFLRRNGKRGAGRYLQRRSLVKTDKLMIVDRPKIVEERARIGDWERDLFYAKDGKAILICVDRKSRFIKLKKLPRGNGEEVQKATLELINETGKKAHTVTNDNGPEFRKNLPIGIPVYFCKPQRPNQRGTVENTIGLLRQYITRKTDIKDYTKDKISELEQLLNFRPRKCLDYKTPFEVYYDKKVALALTN